MPAVPELRQPRGAAFTIRDPLPWDDVVAITREGERLGYEAVFLPEIGVRDALATLVGLAGETSRLLLGTGVIPMGARTPELAATAAATVQERSGGRHVLGVGTGGSRPGALDRLRSYVEEVRRRLDGARLDLHAPVPVWMAALGPRATRLAGEVADGVLLNWCTPGRVAEAREAVRVAAGGDGRDPDAVTVAVYVRAAFSGRAEEAMRRAAAEYASNPAYARQFRAMGVEVAADAVVRAVCLPGDPDRARARLDGYRGVGADLVVVYPVLAPGEDADASIAVLRALAP
jgi:alkanesulfonate monooxygenase SsuD/methylene tetrahydromethanopterin reductase-like flavin-dependent oxidoreductase (luciferase family)